MMHSGQCVLPRSPGAVGLVGSAPIGTSMPAMWQSGTASDAIDASSDDTSGQSAVHVTAATARHATRRRAALMARIVADPHPSPKAEGESVSCASMKKEWTRLQTEWSALSLY